MPTVRTLLAPLALVALALTTTSCLQDWAAPCFKAGSLDPGDGFLDDIWSIETVAGAPIPHKGYPIPGDKDGNVLLGGSVQFKTRDKVGQCSNPKSSSGIAIASYLLGDASGVSKTGQSASGRFEFTNSTGVITLSAFNKSVPGLVNGSLMTFIGPVVEDGIPGLISIKFRRAGATP
jgi:hypothetical protein